MGDNSLNDADWISDGAPDGAPSLQGLIEAQRKNRKRNAICTDEKHRIARFSSKSGLDFLDLSPWGSDKIVSVSRLATEVVLYGRDVARMSEAYGLTQDGYMRLLRECDSLKNEVENVQTSIGSGDTLQARFRDLAASSFDVLAEIIFSSEEKGLVRLKAIEIAAKYGGLEPVKAVEGGQQQAVQVIINGADAATGLSVAAAAQTKSDRQKATELLERRARDLEEDYRQKVMMDDAAQDGFSEDEGEPFPS